MSHPARFSPAIIDRFAEILLGHWPDWFGRPLLFDPWGGTFERLAELADRTGFHYDGVEIEEVFIIAPGGRQGDSTEWESYPPARFPREYGSGHWALISSCVYPNGFGDYHLSHDASTRKNYRQAKADITDNQAAELHPNNMGRYGYRGSKRPEEGGTSSKRAAYWRLAQESVRWWDTAELVLLNVSDFVYTRNGEEKIEPLVDDWCELLRTYGWTDQIRHEVVTPRMRHGENADKRVPHEAIIEARRA